MNILGNSRIGRRIVVLVLISVTLSIVAVTGAFLWLQVHDSIHTRREAIEAMGYVFASAIADHVANRNHHEAFNVLRSIRRVPDIRHVVALDVEGRQIASLGTASMLGDDIVDEKAGWYSLLTRGWFPVVTEIVKAGRPIGRLIIVADVSNFRFQVIQAMLATLFSALLAGGVGIAAAMRLQRRITGPIGSLIHAMTHIRKVRDYSTKVLHQSDDETGMLVDAFNGMMADISYRDAALRSLAYFDPLTGLANRQEFQRRLDAVLRKAQQDGSCAALFLVDLDEFKSVNDSFGHSAGDSLLMDVAARFKAECPPNMLLARLGGDEFAVIAEEVATEADAQTAIAPIVASLSSPIETFGRQVVISASAGVALILRDGTSAADLLRRADLALYDAKRNGRARVHFYHPRLEEDAQALMALAHDLRLAAERGQLEAYYQPQVDIRTSCVAGFESLLRWKHPEHGYISPAKFIPVAENNGLISDLGQWILRESCRQARTWMDQGHYFQLSVNVSVAQLRQEGFVEEVKRILSETGFPGSSLCLELTESLFAGQLLNRIREILEQLKALGVHLAIDDFGTGYSSLSYLQGFPFDKLKIDRAFVSGIGSDPGKRRLLRGMIDLAHALNLTVVAEGAETGNELTVLRDMRADIVQGYVFSRPLPAAEAMAFLRSMAEQLPDGELLKRRALA